MKKFFLVLAILFCASLARAQGQGNTVMVFSGSAFSGSCSGIMLGNDIVNGNLYFCAGPGYTWTAIGGSSVGGSFANLTSGTNTTAAMHVGTGASLDSTGGPIVATSTTGNAATATALASAPTQCTGNVFSQGITAAGNCNGVQPAASNLSNGVTGSGAVVLQNQPVINGVSFSQYAGLANPAAPTGVATTGTGSLAAGTYYYACAASNGVGNTTITTNAGTVLSSTGEVTVTCPVISGAVAYGFYGRSAGNGAAYMAACTGAGVPISQCTSANVFIDDGTISPAASDRLSSTINTTTGICFGPPSGNPTGSFANATFNDVCLARIGQGNLAIVSPYSGNNGAVLTWAAGFTGPFSIGMTGSGLNSVTGVAGQPVTSNTYITASSYISAASYLLSGINSIAYSTTPTLNFTLGNTQQFTCTTSAASIVPTVSNIASAKGMPGGTVIFVQNGTTACTWAWPSTMHGAPAVSATLSSISTFHFVTSANGTDMYYIGGTQGTTGGTP